MVVSGDSPVYLRRFSDHDDFARGNISERFSNLWQKETQIAESRIVCFDHDYSDSELRHVLLVPKALICREQRIE